MDRADEIKMYIKDRMEYNEKPFLVKFYISTPAFNCCYGDLNRDENIKKALDILEKNKVKYTSCDTYPGTFNLNQEWICFDDPIEAIVEFCGVYPIHWDINDVVEFEKLIIDGKIIVMVDWYDEEGNYIGQNH